MLVTPSISLCGRLGFLDDTMLLFTPYPGCVSLQALLEQVPGGGYSTEGSLPSLAGSDSGNDSSSDGGIIHGHHSSSASDSSGERPSLKAKRLCTGFFRCGPQHVSAWLLGEHPYRSYEPADLCSPASASSAGSSKDGWSESSSGSSSSSVHGWGRRAFERLFADVVLGRVKWGAPQNGRLSGMDARLCRAYSRWKLLGTNIEPNPGPRRTSAPCAWPGQPSARLAACAYAPCQGHACGNSTGPPHAAS